MRKKLVIILTALCLGLTSFSATTETTSTKKAATKVTKTSTTKKVTPKAKTKAKPVAPKKKVAIKTAPGKTKAQLSAAAAAAAAIEASKPEYRSYLVGDKYGNILYGENMDEKLPLASTTKTMTMILAFDAIRKGEVSLQDDVTITWEAARMGGSMIPLKAGQVWKFEDLLKATGIHSANNAAYAVAIHVGKDIDSFVKRMNDKAEEIGIGSEVEFNTPAGLPPKMTQRQMDAGTARGMYRIMLEANKYPEYIAIAGTKNAKIADDTVLIRSKNHLLGKQGIYGLKTGYHGTSGYNILVMGEQDNLTLFYVLLGGRSAKIRDQKVLDLDDRTREKYAEQEIVKRDIALAEIPVETGKKALISAYPAEDYIKVVKKMDNVSVKIERQEKIKAPVLAGTEVGKYKVVIDGDVVHEGKLIVNEAVEKKSLWDRFLELFNF
ncbi:MAG: D-alanyl-D-alanine carboxypeptidase family protein [Fusobacteriaceae bacterium]